MIKCEYYAELISAYADGELDTALEPELLAHLDACDECCKMLSFYRELSAVSAALIVQPPAVLSENVMRTSVSKRFDWKRYMPRTFTLAAAAVALVLLAQSGVFGDYFANYNDDEAGLVPQTPTLSDASTGSGDNDANIAMFTLDSDAAEVAEDTDVEYLPEPDDSANLTGVDSGLLLVGDETEPSDSDDVVTIESTTVTSSEVPQMLIEEIEDQSPVFAKRSSEGLVPEQTAETQPPQIDSIPVDAPEVGSEVRLPTRSFAQPQIAPTLDDNGRIDILSAGEIMFVIVWDGENSVAYHSTDEISDIALMLAGLDILPCEDPAISSASNDYTINYQSGGVLTVKLYSEGYVKCGDLWFSYSSATIEN